MDAPNKRPAGALETLIPNAGLVRCARRQSEVRQLFRQAKRPGLEALDKGGDIVRLEQTLA